jgi:hypothetical protein
VINVIYWEDYVVFDVKYTIQFSFGYFGIHWNIIQSPLKYFKMLLKCFKIHWDNLEYFKIHSNILDFYQNTIGIDSNILKYH